MALLKRFLFIWSLPFVYCGSTRTTTTFATSICTTNYGSVKVQPVPRTTYATTTHSHVSLTETTTPSTTSTPATFTTTSVSTVTDVTTSTLDTITDSFTTTLTYYTTISETTSITETTTTTSTSTSSINIASTTISEAAGFTPIADSPLVMQAGGGSYKPISQNKRSVQALKRSPQKETDFLSPAPLYPVKANAAGAVTKRSSYPTQVVCSKTKTLVTMTIYTSTASTTTVTAATPTSTITSMTTSISTVYSTPADVSTTFTQSTTISTTTTLSSTITITQTQTSTTTEYIAATTTYAVCQDSANFVNYIDGSYVYNVQPYAGYTSTTATSTYDCCAACASLTDCGVSLFSDYDNYCALLSNGGDCDPTVYDMEFGLQSEGVQMGYYIISNTNCGQAMYDASLNQ